MEYCLPQTHSCMLANGREARINFPKTGWTKLPTSAVTLRDGVQWSSGFDILLGPQIHEEIGGENWPGSPCDAYDLTQLIGESRPFDLATDVDIPDGLQALKIGVVAYNPGAEEEAFSEVGGPPAQHVLGIAMSWANRVKGFLKMRIAAVLGEKDDVMIYTGRITHVGTDHIEYNVNTYKGCSGGAVIVMDRQHRAFGKVIAIHAGFSTGLKTNLGFKLVGNFDRA